MGLAFNRRLPRASRELESIPPERQLPNGTSLRSLKRTASSSNSRNEWAARSGEDGTESWGSGGAQ